MSRLQKGGRGSSSRPSKPGFGKKGFKDDKKSSGKFVRREKSGDDTDKRSRKKDDDRFEKKFNRDDKRGFKSKDDSFKKDKFKSEDRGGKKFDRDDKRGFKKKDDSEYKKDKFKSDDRYGKKFDRDDKRGFKSKEGSTFKKDKFKSNDRYEKKFDRDDKREFKSKEGSSFKKDKFKSNDRYGKKFDRDDKRGFKGRENKFENKEDGSEKKNKRYLKDFSPKKSYDKKTAYDEYMSDEYDHEAKKKSFEKGKNEYNRLLKKSEKYLGKQQEKEDDGGMRLNRYIANSGVCSRRDADKLIQAGAVKVNGVVVTQLGTKVKPGDRVQYGDQTIKTEKNVYIVLNKPKDYITTMDDPEGRKTVMSLIRGAAKERVYPVGRLDRNTTGVLLFTNDGELTRRLTHPKFLVSKMYHVELDKNFSKDDLTAMRNGLELEDGYIKPDQLEYSGESKRELGIEIHSGRNRIVRRMFEHLGYTVTKLDRVMFAGLNKKDIPRGKWRFLSEKEVGFLKML